MSVKRLQDTTEGYGCVSRFFHWSMAALFAWQFASALMRVLAKGSTIGNFFWSTHYSIGSTLWALVLARGAWGLANFRRRPKHAGTPSLRRAVAAGHLTLYALMAAVPTLAILRAAGSGRGLTVYGIELVAPDGRTNAAMTAPGNALHGLLGWMLLALVLGHVGMALWHGYVRRDGTLARMKGGAS